jgi:hypothetical protein
MKSDIIPSLHRGLIDDRSVVQTGVKSNSLEVMYSITYFTLAIYSGTIYFLVSPVYQYMNGHMDSPYAIPILGTYVWFTWLGKAYFGHITDSYLLCGRRTTPYFVLLILGNIMVVAACIIIKTTNVWIMLILCSIVVTMFSFIDAVAQGLTTFKLQLECESGFLENFEQRERYCRSCSKHFGHFVITKFASRLCCLGFGTYASVHYKFNTCMLIFVGFTSFILMFLLCFFKELKKVPKKQESSFWSLICQQLSIFFKNVLSQRLLLGVTLALCSPNLAVETYILANNDKTKENILPLYSLMALGLVICMFPTINLIVKEATFRKVTLIMFCVSLLLSQASLSYLAHNGDTSEVLSFWIDAYLFLSNLTNCLALLPLVSACSSLIQSGRESLSINLISTFYNVAVLISRSILLLEDSLTEGSFVDLEFSKLYSVIDINAIFSVIMVVFLITLSKRQL